MKTIAQRKKISKQSALKLVNAKLFEVRKTEKMLDKHLAMVEGWINDVQAEKRVALKRKRALEEGDTVTMTVEEVESAGGEDVGDEGGFEDAGDGDGAEEVVDMGSGDEMQKEFKRLQTAMFNLERKIKAKKPAVRKVRK